MNKLINLIILLFMTAPTLAQISFLENQLKFERVKNAHDEKWDALRNELTSKGFADDFEIYIAAYKSEGKLELWVKKSAEHKFKLFKTYDFCAHSGTLGPKVIEGDKQTPEGFYKINVFNPESTYYLSLGLGYPNKVDLTRTGKGRKPGDDIYIHGNCVTVGCIPLTNDKIKEVYLLAIYAKSGGQNEISVHIFPFKMSDENLKKFGAQHQDQLSFWQNLQHVYTYFATYKILPTVTQIKGKYFIK